MEKENFPARALQIAEKLNKVFNGWKEKQKMHVTAYLSLACHFHIKKHYIVPYTAGNEIFDC